MREIQTIIQLFNEFMVKHVRFGRLAILFFCKRLRTVPEKLSEFCIL